MDAGDKTTDSKKTLNKDANKTYTTSNCTGHHGGTKEKGALSSYADLKSRKNMDKSVDNIRTAEKKGIKVEQFD